MKRRRGSNATLKEVFRSQDEEEENSKSIKSNSSVLTRTVQEFETLRSILIYGAPLVLSIAVAAVLRYYNTVGLLWSVSTFTSFIFSVTLFSLCVYVLNRLNSVLSGLAKPCYEILEYNPEDEHLIYINFNRIPEASSLKLILSKSRPLSETPTLRPWDHSVVKRLFNRDGGTVGSKKYLLVVRYSDRLGNNLFQYVYARVLATVLQIPFLSPEKLQKPFDSLDLLVLPRSFPKQVEMSKMRLKNTKHEDVMMHSTMMTTSLPISSTEFLSTPVSNYAMNTQLYSHELMREIVNQWLWPSVQAWRNKQSTSIDTSFSDIVIHVRLGDILWGHHAAYRPLPISFYLTAIDHIYTSQRETSRTIKKKGSSSPFTVLIVTDDPKHIIVERMKSIIQLYLQGNALYGHKHRGSSFGAFQSSSSSSSLSCTVDVKSVSVSSDFNSLLSAKLGLILSVSSFSWWAAAMLYWSSPRSGLRKDDDNDNDDDDASFDQHFYPTIVVPRYGLFQQQTWTPAPRLCPTVVDVIHCLQLGRPNDQLSNRSMCIDIDLSSLQRWAGNTKSAIETLFEN